MARKTGYGYLVRCIVIISGILSLILIGIEIVSFSDRTVDVVRFYLQPPDLSTSPISVLHHYINTSTTVDSTNLLVPFRDESTKHIAWSKLWNGIGKLIIIHARKAGGTMMKSWLFQKMIRLNEQQEHEQGNNTWSNIEFWTFAHDGENTVDKLYKTQPEAVYAACFRHPVERIISNYDFEWRWGCQRCSVLHEAKADTLFSFNKDYKPEEDEQSMQHKKKHKLSNMELEQLMEEVDRVQPWNHTLVKGRIAYNAYLDNYYLWMFCCDSKHCNIRKDFIETNRIHECMQHAKRAILSIDILIINEWVNDVRTQYYVESLIFGKETKIGNRTTPLSSKPNKTGKVRKYGSNHMVDGKLYRTLMEMNKWDLELYEWMKQVAFEREAAMWNAFGTVHH